MIGAHHTPSANGGMAPIRTAGLQTVSVLQRILDIALPSGYQYRFKENLRGEWLTDLAWNSMVAAPLPSDRARAIRILWTKDALQIINTATPVERHFAEQYFARWVRGRFSELGKSADLDDQNTGSPDVWVVEAQDYLS